MKEDLARRQLLARAYRLGFDYERQFRGCSQCVIAAVQDTLGIQDDTVFRAASGLAGGGALTGRGACGGLVGGAMVLGQLRGRDRRGFDDPEGIRFRTFDLVKKLTDRFDEEFGGIICRDIQTRVFGRPFNLGDPEDFQRFEDAGAHDDKCPDVVGKAAAMAVGIILEAALVSPGRASDGLSATPS